jgi:hypothetical protein
MANIKIPGCCSICDQEVFEILEKKDGIPTRVGQPKDEAQRVTFLLSGGEHMDLTFCAQCASVMNEEDYPELWKKVLRSWEHELKGKEPAWFLEMKDKSIQSEVETNNWKKVIANAH